MYGTVQWRGNSPPYAGFFTRPGHLEVKYSTTVKENLAQGVCIVCRLDADDRQSRLSSYCSRAQPDLSPNFGNPSINRKNHPAHLKHLLIRLPRDTINVQSNLLTCWHSSEIQTYRRGHRIPTSNRRRRIDWLGLEDTARVNTAGTSQLSCQARDFKVFDPS